MSNEIHDCVRRTLNRYFRDLDGQAPHAVYEMVLQSVEKPMLEVVMKQANGNQSAAAQGGFSMSSDMKVAFFFALFAFTIIFVDLIWHRVRLGALQEKVEQLKLKLSS